MIGCLKTISPWRFWTIVRFFQDTVCSFPNSTFATLNDLPTELVGPLFANAQLLVLAVEQGLLAEGTFVAINNRVSQSVPHLHIHVVPRRKKDGLKGFFWPRQSYRDREHLESVLRVLQETIAELKA